MIQFSRICCMMAIVSAIMTTVAMAQSQPAPSNIQYDYPAQRGQEELIKTDKNRTILTDGQIRSDGPGSVWGKWNASPILIDWQFTTPARIQSIEITLVHTKEDSSNVHADRVELFGSDKEAASDNEFLEIPDAVQDISFQRGRTQTVFIQLAEKNDGLVCQRLRMKLRAAKYQVVLSEVKFNAIPATSAESQQAQQQRINLQPPALQSVQFLPAPVQFSHINTIKYPESIFGFCGHMLHTDEFYNPNPTKPSKFSAYWRLEYTLSHIIASNAGWVREPLYGSFFKGSREATSPNGLTYGKNRDMVSRDLNLYDKSGIKVMLCPFLVKPDDADFNSYISWLISLAKIHSSIAAIELHNEPNLRGFWKGTPQEYIDSCKAYYKEFKNEIPNIPVIVGSFSGWGHGQYGDSNTNNYGGGGKKSPIAIAFAEEIFDSDLLEYTDAVSAHPYRNFTAPEGGVELESPKDPQGFEKEIKTWWNLVQKYNKTNKPLKVHFSELGYSVSKPGYATVPSEQRQADYASRLMLILFNARLGGFPLESVMWYDLKNDENAGEYESNFGMISSDLSFLRPSFIAYRRIAEQFAHTSHYQQSDIKLAFSNEPENVKSYVWRNTSDHSFIIAFWRMNQLQKSDRNFPAEITLTLPSAIGKIQSVELTDLHEDRPRYIGFSSDQQGVVRIPVYVTSRAAWLKLNVISANSVLVPAPSIKPKSAS